jgi:hypothetical protein
MGPTPFSVIGLLGFLGLLEFLELVEFTDFELKEPYKLNEPNKRPLAFQANASVKSFSLSILRFQVEIWGTT